MHIPLFAKPCFYSSYKMGAAGAADRYSHEDCLEKLIRGEKI